MKRLNKKGRRRKIHLLNLGSTFYVTCNNYSQVMRKENLKCIEIICRHLSERISVFNGLIMTFVFLDLLNGSLLYATDCTAE